MLSTKKDHPDAIGNKSKGFMVMHQLQETSLTHLHYKNVHRNYKTSGAFKYTCLDIHAFLKCNDNPDLF